MKLYPEKFRQVSFIFVFALLFLYCFSMCIQKDTQEGTEDEIGYLYVVPEDEPSLYIMARNGQTERIKRILEKYPELINEPAEEKRVLTGAIETGRLELVNYLLKKGATVNSYDYSPLAIAAESGNKEMIALLVNSGMPVDQEEDNDYHTPLVYAVKSGDIESVRFLLKKGADVNAGYEPPLHCAVEMGNREMMKLLLKYGANINASMRGENGDTPLCVAMKKNDVPSVLFLLDKGADIHIKNDNDWTPLHYAAMHGNREMMELFLKKDADVNVITKEYDYTPIWLAAWSGDTVSVCYLLEQGAVINKKPSLLLAAAKADNWEMFEFLLDKVPQPTDWNDIWEEALGNNNVEIVRYLVETVHLDINKEIEHKYWSRLPLKMVMYNKELEGEAAQRNKILFNYLIEKGADLALVNNGNVMNFVMFESNQDTFDYLIEKGFSIEDVDESMPPPPPPPPFEHPALYPLSGLAFPAAKYLLEREKENAGLYHSPLLYFANWMGNWREQESPADILEFLVKENVDTEYWPGAFRRCILFNDLESALVFLTHEVDINAKDRRGLNALWYVSDTDVAEYLVLHGIDVSIPLVYEDELIDMAVLRVFEKYGIPIRLSQEELDEALRVAARWGDSKMVDFFIRKGADINGQKFLSNDDGATQRTPLHQNAWLGYERFSYSTGNISPKVTRQLIQAGADVNAVDIHGETPLHYALDDDHCYRERYLTRADRDRNPYGRCFKKNYSLIALELINAGADVNRINQKGYTPLILAIENQYKNVVSALLERGVDVNFRAADGMTPLQMAVVKGDACIARLLVEAGAEIEVFDNKGVSLLDKIEHYQTFSLFKELGYTIPVSEATLAQMFTDLIKDSGATLNTRYLDDLLAYGVSINQLMKWTGEPALVNKIYSWDLSSVKALLERGIEVDWQNWKGNTALLGAIDYSRPVEIIECLLEHGANPYIKNENGLDAFGMALERDKKSISRLLEKYVKG